MLPSQDEMVYRVLDCFWIHLGITGDPTMKYADVLGKLRAALLLTADDRHAGGKRTVKADELRIRTAIYRLRDAGMLDFLCRGTYSITARGIRMATEGSGSMEEERLRCRILLTLLMPEGAPGNLMFERIACRVVAKKTGIPCKTTPFVCDGGVDGVGTILGKPVYYVQAKRYSGIERVANPPVQQLVGCCCDAVETGYFVTTSTFAKSALDVVDSKKSVKIVPIDGREVAAIMWSNHIGVSKTGSIDFEFFEWLMA